MTSLVKKLEAIVDGYYVGSDYYIELVDALTKYEIERTNLSPEAILWLAALYEVPIEKRIEWVAEMMEQLNAINKIRREAFGGTTTT